MKDNYLSIVFVIIMIGVTFFNQKYNKEETIRAIKNDSKTEKQASVVSLADLKPVSFSELILKTEELEKKIEEEVIKKAKEVSFLEKKGDSEDNEEKEKPKIPDFEIAAKVAAVYDLTTEKEIYSKNPEMIWPMASITKIMTAVVAVEEMGFEAPIKISEEVLKTEEIAGDFNAEEEFVLRDMIMSLFLVSSNDGAEAIAENYKRERFIEKLNQKATEIGMEKTFYREPAGLSSENVTTVQDLEKLMTYVYKEKPELLFFSRQKETEITDLKFGNKKKYKSINEFAGELNFIGGKTGYTDIARGNLVSVFSKNGHAILIIILGTEDRFSETRKLLEWVEI
ncbi:MAG: serine hydrolase [Candidatus Pacebacteria bacterium]|nr:serine hydrolase [Candidatus Paceibacterota bacterium]